MGRRHQALLGGWGRRQAECGAHGLHRAIDTVQEGAVVGQEAQRETPASNIPRARQRRAGAD